MTDGRREPRGLGNPSPDAPGEEGARTLRGGGSQPRGRGEERLPPSPRVKVLRSRLDSAARGARGGPAAAGWSPRGKPRSCRGPRGGRRRRGGLWREKKAASRERPEGAADPGPAGAAAGSGTDKHRPSRSIIGGQIISFLDKYKLLPCAVVTADQKNQEGRGLRKLGRERVRGHDLVKVVQRSPH